MLFWISQGFALLGLIFLVSSYLQKKSKGIIWLATLSISSVLIGLIVMREISGIIMGAAGVVRGIVSLLFAYKPNINQRYKIIAGVLLAVAVVILNIVFWQGLLNLFSILIGVFYVVMYLQKNATIIRIMGMIGAVLDVTYYALLLAPVNIVMNIIAGLFALIGFLKFDVIKRKENLK